MGQGETRPSLDTFGLAQGPKAQDQEAHQRHAAKDHRRRNRHSGSVQGQEPREVPGEPPGARPDPQGGHTGCGSPAG